jgi:hypothetical protein
MKAYLVTRYKSRIQAGEVAEPALDNRSVLVDIHAAGVNMLDARRSATVSSSCSWPTRCHSSSDTISPGSLRGSGRP